MRFDIQIVLYRWSWCQPAIPDVQDLHVSLHGSDSSLVTNLPSAWALCLWVEVFPVLYSLVIYDFGGVEYTWLWVGYLQTPLAIKETLRHFLESRYVLFSLPLFVMIVQNVSPMRTILTGDRFANRLLWLMTATAHAMAISVTITYYGFEYNPDNEAYKNVNPWLSLQEKFCTHNFHLIQVSYNNYSKLRREIINW